MSIFFKEIDRGWDRIKKQMALMKDSFVKVGVLSNSGTYAEEGEDEGSGAVNIADVATFNEYGTSKIPERPFMRQTFEREIGKVNKFIADEKDKILSGEGDVKSSLDGLGEIYKGMIQRTFVEGEFTQNAPSTLLANWRKRHQGIITRGEALENSSGFGVTKKPLIDTGTLRQRINYEVTVK